MISQISGGVDRAPRGLRSVAPGARLLAVLVPMAVAGCHDFSLFDHFDLDVGSGDGAAPVTDGAPIDASIADHFGDAPTADLAMAVDAALGRDAGLVEDLSTIDLGQIDLAPTDLSVGDLAIPDLAMPDLAMPDLAMPDFAMPDFAMTDLAMPDLAKPDLSSMDLAPDGPPDLAQCEPLVCGNRCGVFFNACGHSVKCVCANNQECDGNNQCCTYAGDNAFCAGKCGTVTANDNCGVQHVVACPGCGAMQACVNNACCTPESDKAFCARLNKNCGSLSANDNCGAPRTVHCGPCAVGGATPACVNNVCAPCRDANDCSSGFAWCEKGLCVSGCDANLSPACASGLGSCVTVDSLGVCECQTINDCTNPRVDRCSGVNGICVCGNAFDACPSGQVCSKGVCL